MEHWLTAIVPLVSIVVGAYLGYFLGARSKRDDSILRFKEEKYTNLLVKLQGFVGATASAALKREFFTEQYQSWLYASDDVVLAINSMVEQVKADYHAGIEPDPRVGHRLVGEVVLSMRRDLLRKTRLKYDAFTYTDVDARGDSAERRGQVQRDL